MKENTLALTRLPLHVLGAVRFHFLLFIQTHHCHKFPSSPLFLLICPSFLTSSLQLLLPGFSMPLLFLHFPLTGSLDQYGSMYSASTGRPFPQSICSPAASLMASLPVRGLVTLLFTSPVQQSLGILSPLACFVGAS